MSNRFVVVDVETANTDMASICQVGIVTFDDGAIEDRWSTLVDPEDYFDGTNVSIHGITEDDVEDAPTFPDIERELRERFAETVVVSHMPFDRLALAKACRKYRLRGIECTWLDTAKVTRRAWPQFSRRGYGLASIAAWLDIDFEHHDAEEDARAAGHVLLHAIEHSGLTVHEWVLRADQPIGWNSDT